jgi:TFIIF-interacting CTD phosphatase-like protein
MDETLIHARFLDASNTDTKVPDDGDFIVNLQSKTDESDQVRISVKMRPYLDNCLEHLEKSYEIAVFTAGE